MSKPVHSNFKDLKDKINKENNLIRCSTCGKLVCKIDDDAKYINFRKNKVELIAKIKEASVKCPDCSTIIKVK